MDDPWNYHRCKLCSYKSRYIHYIFQHVRQHKRRSKDHRFACDLHPPEKYKCQKCNFQSDLKVLLREHFDTVHRTKETRHYPTPDVLRSCENCDFQTYSSLVLLRHDNFCNGSGSSDDVKDEDLIERGNAEMHLNDLLTHTNVKGKCNDCFYETTTKELLKEHIQNVHIPSEDDWPVMDDNSIECEKELIQTNNEKENVIFHCSNCPYKTSSSISLKFHVLKKHHVRKKHTRTTNQKKVGLLRCSSCSFKTKYKGSLKSHVIRKHTPADQIDWCKCTHCPYKTKMKSDLHSHMSHMHLKHSQSKKMKQFKCDQCQYETLDEQNMKAHSSILCKKNSFEVDEKCNMVQHILTLQSEAENFKCNDCSYKATTEEFLEEHIQNVDITLDGDLPLIDGNSIECEKERIDSNQLTQTNNGKENEFFYCSNCPYKTSSSVSLKFHELWKHTRIYQKKGGFFRCSYCSFKTEYKVSLKSHVIRKHTPADQIDWRKCTHCSYKTKTQNALRKHMLLKHSQSTKMKQFKCNQCPYETEEEQNMNAHIILCKKNSCEVKEKCNMVQPILTLHPEAENFKCNDCSYKTTTKELLEEHIRQNVHIPSEDDLPVMDENAIECEKEGIDSNQLTHTNNEKENEFFHCSNCPYKTSSNTSLKFHVLRKHTRTNQKKDGVFRCGSCSFKTKYKRSLTNHVIWKHTSAGQVDSRKCDGS